jgi:rubredoxin
MKIEKEYLMSEEERAELLKRLNGNFESAYEGGPINWKGDAHCPYCGYINSIESEDFPSYENRPTKHVCKNCGLIYRIRLIDEPQYESEGCDQE